MTLGINQFNSSGNSYDVVRVGYLRGILELCIFMLVITTLCVTCFRLVRCNKKKEKWFINAFDIVLVILYCLVLGLYGIVRLLNFEDWLYIYALCFIVVMSISIYVVAILYCKQREKREQMRMEAWKQKQEERKRKTQALDALLRPHLQEIKMGYFGTFPKDKICFGYILDDAIEQSDDTAVQVNFVMEKVKEWQKLIESHTQFIINYFMYQAIENTYATETGFWENYIKDKIEFSNEKCLAIFKQKYTEIVKNELSEYLAKDTTKDIKELFQRHFPFFDYDRFIAGIKLQNLVYDTESFSIELSDENISVFCSACEEFDQNLEGNDWHNF